MGLPSPDAVFGNEAFLSRIRESLKTQQRGGRLTADLLRQTLGIQLRAYYPQIAEKNDQESQIWTVQAYALLEEHFSAEFDLVSSLTGLDKETIAQLQTDEEYKQGKVREVLGDSYEGVSNAVGYYWDNFNLLGVGWNYLANGETPSFPRDAWNLLSEEIRERVVKVALISAAVVGLVGLLYLAPIIAPLFRGAGTLASGAQKALS